MDNQHQTPPSIFKMVKSFTSELGKWIKEGAPSVSPKQYADRLDVCHGCEFLKKQSMRCTHFSNNSFIYYKYQGI